MNGVLKGYLRLTRPANLPTAVADILAGVSIAGVFKDWEHMLAFTSEMWSAVLFLMLSSVCLYAGGVVLNDFFDRNLDAIERPERPIPSKVVSAQGAFSFGSVLLLLGILTAFYVTKSAGFIAVFLALAILMYNAISKHHVILGPLNMGFCRGLNLLLGMAILGNFSFWPLGGIPILYIAAITLVSQGEVLGGNTRNVGIAAVLYGVVILGILALGYHKSINFVVVLLFVALFAFLIYKPLLKSYRHNSSENIKAAVKAGVIALIVMDAALAVAFSHWWVGLMILMLLPLSKFLARQFAVT
ncbi:UbiA-like protein EboC [Arenibacter sp. GZD96]|uniref:UbiA-like protein EboC n=1 Tax=Aurantibrevibacter litoralis TaxID=3106030 RepID=UPI002B001452|nr:UbiA-like protein EboC [Arenibacter sp. GZD-96]MEA1785994.1 UbiA-like protein EboC [Arenibacter sp. GZD-96]